MTLSVLMSFCSCINEYEEISDCRYCEIYYSNTNKPIEIGFHSYKIDNYEKFNDWFNFDNNFDNSLILDVLEKGEKYFKNRSLILITFKNRYDHYYDIECVKIEKEKLSISLFYTNTIIDDSYGLECHLIEIENDDLDNIKGIEIIKNNSGSLEMEVLEVWWKYEID